MKLYTGFENQRILVLGLAKSGVSVAKLLNDLGAFVTVNDQKPLEENPQAQELVEAGIRVITGSHPLELFEESFACLVKNPGIPYSNPMIEKAIELGLPVYTEIEVAYRILEGNLIGITGSNGKTTTTTITSMILAEEFKNQKVFAAGNIGLPLSQLAETSTPSDFYVTELSSFQLMGIEEFKPKIAAILNLSTAHIDYHGTREAYIEAKLRITENQKESDFLVYNADDAELSQLVKTISAAKLIPFSRTKALTLGAYSDEENLYFNGEKVISRTSIQVPGEQNVENILAVIAITKLLGVSDQAIQTAVEAFKGVKHRTQFVAEINSRRFYNDSKATNITATQTALRSFGNKDIVLIAGGLDRGNGFEELIPDLSSVETMVVYGQTKDKLRAAAEAAHIPTIIQVDKLNQAVDLAYQNSQEGDIILFSPACASWDQYENFEIRGDEFIQLVEQIANLEQ